MGWKLAELFVDLSLKTQDFDDTLKQAFKECEEISRRFRASRDARHAVDR
jgi:hypothetical protein